MTVRLLNYGESAVLAEYQTLTDVMSAADWLRNHPLSGVIEIVPAMRTITVLFDPAATDPRQVKAWLEVSESTFDWHPVQPNEVVVTARYDGADLAATAELLGISVDRLVQDHAAAEWRVAFTGFSPGFGYLVSSDWVHEVPRLATPRTAVPAGAVGLAAEFSGVYPRSSPGGWRLIATTDLQLWDPAATPPALLLPGTLVRFQRESG